MRWIDQTTPTNCVAACIASLTSIPLAEVPDVMVAPGGGWPELRKWLRARGWIAIDLRGSSIGRGYVLFRGMSSRGTRHCVVGLDGRVVHDPHASRDGLVSVDRVTELVPVGPLGP